MRSPLVGGDAESKRKQVPSFLRSYDSIYKSSRGGKLGIELVLVIGPH